MHGKIGSKWSQISKMEPLLGRTVSQIKNRFYQNLKDKDISLIKYKKTDNGKKRKCQCSEMESDKENVNTQNKRI